MKKTRKEMICESRIGSGSRLRVRKVLSPYNVRPKMIPLIK